LGIRTYRNSKTSAKGVASFVFDVSAPILRTRMEIVSILKHSSQRRLVNLSFFLASSNLSFLFVDLNCFEKNFPYLLQALVLKVGMVRLVLTSNNDFVFCPSNGKHRWYRIASAKNAPKTRVFLMYLLYGEKHWNNTCINKMYPGARSSVT